MIMETTPILPFLSKSALDRCVKGSEKTLKGIFWEERALIEPFSLSLFAFFKVFVYGGSETWFMGLLNALFATALVNEKGLSLSKSVMKAPANYAQVL